MSWARHQQPLSLNVTRVTRCHKIPSVLVSGWELELEASPSYGQRFLVVTSEVACGRSAHHRSRCAPASLRPAHPTRSTSFSSSSRQPS